jgi:hypothetical protein
VFVGDGEIRTQAWCDIGKCDRVHHIQRTLFDIASSLLITESSFYPPTKQHYPNESNPLLSTREISNQTHHVTHDKSLALVYLPYYPSMLTDIDLNNFISFGVLADEGEADVHQPHPPHT